MTNNGFQKKYPMFQLQLLEKRGKKFFV